MDHKVTGTLSFLVLLTLILVSGQMSDVGVLTGQFYTGENTSALEKQYNSINWTSLPEETQPSGAIHLESFEKLNLTKMKINNQSKNLSPKKALLIGAQENKSLNISFSKEIAGTDGNNLKLYNGSKVKIRIRNNISLKIKKRNQTFRKKIQVKFSQNNSKEPSKNQSRGNETENDTVLPRINLSANTSRKITTGQIILENTENYTILLETPKNNSENSSHLEVSPNKSLNFNKSKEKTLNITALNKTRYVLDYIEKENKGFNETRNNSENISYGSRSENKTIVKNESVEVNRTVEINETSKDQNSTQHQIKNSTSPNKGGEWAEIQSGNLEDFYIFKYEASRKDANSTNEGESNIPYSQEGVKPWNDVSQEKAKKSCKRLGLNYSLPSNKQWHAAASSTDLEKIRGNIRGGDKSSSNACRTYQDGRIDEICLTGTGPESWEKKDGMSDIKGNLWEWTSTVVNTEKLEKPGESGHITSFGEDLLNPELSDQQESMDNSYFYSSTEGEKAVRRGGGWNSERLSGLYSTLIDRNPQYSSKAIGFRCVYER